MTTKRDFVVLTHGRTGASLLIESLRELGVEAFGELLHEDEESRFDAARQAVVPYSAEDGGDYLAHFYASGPRSRGFKLHYEQARDGPAATAWDFLRDRREIAVIHLVRRDRLASWLSYEVARRTDVWVRSADEAPPPLPAPFEVDAVELGRFFDRVAAQSAWVRQAFAAHPFLEIGYEDGLCERFAPTLARVLEHIGAAPANAPRPPLRQLSSGPAESRIANFEALRDHFRHTAHARYFDRPSTAAPAPANPGFCARPFEFLAVDAKGKIRVCCEDWLPTPIGDVRAGSLKAQWNSPTAVAIRESILDGSYRFCDAQQCPALVKNSLAKVDSASPQRHRKWVEQRRTVIEEAPRTLSLGYDPTCNLKCATCRSDFIVLKGPAFDRAAAIHAEIVSDLMPAARLAIITGQGDAIASRLYRGFLRELDASEMPDLRILLMTNGLALDAAMWASFRAAHPAIAGASISVDAATPETYAVNRGGSFDKLLRNLAFLGELRSRGEIDFLEISFVVQANNFREMPDFVRLGKEVGCTSVLFMKLIHWPGTFAKAELADRSIHDPGHPCHGEFLRILEDPAMAAPGVDLSNLSDLVGTARPREAAAHGA